MMSSVGLMRIDLYSIMMRRDVKFVNKESNF